MALNGILFGSFSGVDSSKVRPAIRWSATQNIPGNYSDITFNLVIYRYSTQWQSFNNDGVSTSIIVDGDEKKETHPFDIRNIPSGSYKSVMTRDVRVKHDESGWKSVDVRGSIAAGVSLGNGTVKGTIYPDRIPRASEISSQRAVNYGNKMQININSKYSGFSDDIYIIRPNGSKTKIADKTNWKSIDFKIPTDWASDVPNSDRIKYKVISETYQGSTLIGKGETTQTVLVPSWMTPEIKDIKIEDTDQDIAKRFGKFIQGESKIRVSFTSVNRWGAKTKENKVVYTNITKRDTSGKNAFSGVIPSLDFKNNLIQIFTTDTRGRTTKDTRTVEALPYQNPEINSFKVERCDSDGNPNIIGDYVKATYKARAMYMDSKNYPKGWNTGTRPYLAIEYTDSDGQTIKVDQEFVEPIKYDDNTFLKTGLQKVIISGIDPLKSYDFEIIVEDYFHKVSLNRSVGTGFVTLSAYRGGRGVTFGQNATQPGLNVEMDSFKHKGKDVLSSESDLGAGWVKFSNGLQITWSQHHVNKGPNNWISLPKKFKTKPALSFTPRSNAVVWHTALDTKTANVKTSQDTDISVIAIGEAEE